MAIGRFLNCKERIQEFCRTYKPTDKAKKLERDDILKPKHWKQLEHLHDSLEPFQEATLMVEGRKTSLADHFQMLDWLLNALDDSKQRFKELADDTRRYPADSDAWSYLSTCAAAAWNKCEKYYLKADIESPAYYAAIVLHPQIKASWFEATWQSHAEKSAYIEPALAAVKAYWNDTYRGRSPHLPSSSSEPVAMAPMRMAPIFTSARAHKRLKVTHSTAAVETDHYEQYITSAPLSADAILQGALCVDPAADQLSTDEIIMWWNNRYYTQPDLARFALDILAVPPMSDDCERVFSGASILIDKRRSRLGMNIIEANECLRCSFPSKKIYDDSILAEALGAATESSRSETLAGQAEERLAASRAVEDAYHIQNEVAEAQTQAEIAEEALLEGSLHSGDSDDEDRDP
jgi:hypothetical protein